jgi:hypothetical protein
MSTSKPAPDKSFPNRRSWTVAGIKLFAVASLLGLRLKQLYWLKDGTSSQKPLLPVNVSPLALKIR